jgi:hypothetical protein
MTLSTKKRRMSMSTDRAHTLVYGGLIPTLPEGYMLCDRFRIGYKGELMLVFDGNGNGASWQPIADRSTRPHILAVPDHWSQIRIGDRVQYENAGVYIIACIGSRAGNIAAISLNTGRPFLTSTSVTNLSGKLTDSELECILGTNYKDVFSIVGKCKIEEDKR